jgi:hypothetical protein
MLLYWWLFARAREQPTRARLLLVGAAFGVLLHAYMYYWTAAALGLAIACVLDSGFRRTYVHVGWIGMLASLPALIVSALAKKHTLPDWLLRTDNFLPIGRMSELLIPVGAVVMLCVTGAWVLLRRRDLIYLWAMGIAGVLLANHQLITGLQIQNYHWAFVWGPALSTLIVLLVSEAVFRFATTRKHFSAQIVVASAILLVLHVSSSFWFRGAEAMRSREPAAIADIYAQFREQRMSRDAVSFSHGLAVAGDQGFVDIAAVAESLRPLDHYAVQISPAVSDAEWDIRIALNALLSGQGRDTFVSRQNERLSADGWGSWTRSRVVFAQRLGQRVAAYDTVATRVLQTAAQLGVGYVALPVGTETPASLGDDWSVVEDGPHWRIWRRRNA